METALKKCLIIGCTGIMITTLLIINITLVVQQLSGRAISSISDSESWRRPYSPVCTSDKCILSANNLLQSMNRNVDPCEDFYKYSCGNWKKEHPIPDTFYKSSWTSDRFHVTMRKVRDFLRTEDSNESTAWKKAKMLYRSCINEDKLQSLGLKPLLKIFKTIGLRKPSQLWSDSVRPNEEWYSIAAKAKKMLALDIFIGLKIQPFFLPGTNRIILKPPSDQDFLPGFFKTDDILKIDSSFTLPERNNKNTSEHVDIKFDQKMFILQMLIDHIALVMGEIFNKPIIAMKDDALQILGLEINTRDLSDIEHKNLIQISVDDFQKFTDNGTGSSQINWKEYFRVMFEDIGVSVLGGDKIIVMQPEYFKRLATIMSSRTRKIVDMYIYWKVADLVSMHTTETIRRSTEYLNKFDTDIEATEARSMICTRVVSHTMEMATLSYIINSEISNTNELKVREMFDNIRNAFLQVINASTWLYADSKDLIKRKAEAIPLLTYPKWILENKKLEEYYETVELTEEHFLLSAMNISKWKMEKVLSSLSTGVVTDELFRNPLSINAYYKASQNTITVLHGFLKFPFFENGIDAMNYGMLGYILGHELHHAFDSLGTLMKTNVSDTWEDVFTLVELIHRRKCFIEGYNNFQWENGLKVNGANTVDENMADHGGVQVSLLAYQALRLNEPKLPGFENYTHEQLFFLSFANLFCNEMTEVAKEAALSDVHAPSAFRLLGSVTNSKEFSRIWGCPLGTKMNPRIKCKLW